MASMKSGGEELSLAERTVEMVKEFSVVGEEDEQQELKEKRQVAEQALARKPSSEALQDAIVALEQVLVAGVQPQIVGSTTPDGQPAGNTVVVTGQKAHLIKARLREILWVVKDAIGCFKDSGSELGRGLALKALARVHLCRSYEPDAPMAALRVAKESVAVFHGIDDDLQQAQALSVAAEAHRTKAGLSPYDRVVEEETENAAQAAKKAAGLFQKVGDKKGEGKALHSLGSVYLTSDDEDQQLEAERYIQEAVELFKDIKNQELECDAMMTAISARFATSGPEAAIALAKDAAADWKLEGGRPKHEGMALHAAAEIHLSLGGSDVDDCAELCKEAMRVFERANSKRGRAGCLQTLLQVANAKGNSEVSLRAAEDVAKACQEVGDKRGEGGALLSVADMLLSTLCSEVGQDTEANSAKKDPPVGLTTEEVSKRTEEGLEFANRAFLCFEEIKDEPGMAEVQNVIQAPSPLGENAGAIFLAITNSSADKAARALSLRKACLVQGNCGAQVRRERCRMDAVPPKQARGPTATVATLCQCE